MLAHEFCLNVLIDFLLEASLIPIYFAKWSFSLGLGVFHDSAIDQGLKVQAWKNPSALHRVSKYIFQTEKCSKSVSKSRQRAKKPALLYVQIGKILSFFLPSFGFRPNRHFFLQQSFLFLLDFMTFAIRIPGLCRIVTIYLIFPSKKRVRDFEFGLKQQNQTRYKTKNSYKFVALIIK